jgi:hypothetical protein
MICSCNKCRLDQALSASSRAKCIAAEDRPAGLGNGPVGLLFVNRVHDEAQN